MIHQQIYYNNQGTYRAEVYDDQRKTWLEMKTIGVSIEVKVLS
jgi:hypothetical protein